MQFGRIIIEPHTYCNRTCDFCLISYMNPIFKNKVFYMTDEILNTTLNKIYENIELFKTDKLTFSLFKYNEPFYDIDNLIHIAATIKKYFSDKNIETYLYVHTNGDYLNSDNFKKAMEYLDCVLINDYNDNGMAYVLDKLYNISKDIKFVEYEKSSINKKDKIFCNYHNKSVIAYVNSTSGMMKTTRGSVIQKHIDIHNSGKWLNNAIERDYECDLLGRVLVVDYDGSITPCCDTSSRIEEHKDMIVGNILNDSITDILQKSKNINIFKKPACKYCHMCNSNCGYIDENIKYGDE